MLLSASWFGTLPGWLTVASVLIAAWLIYRGGGGTALDTLATANRILEGRVRELEKDQAALKAENGELRGRTDVTLALGPLVAWTTQHEQHAQERHVATLNVLQLVADRLGPETGA